MAPPRGSAAYKKQDGTLALSKDGQSVSWTPITPPGAKPALSLPISTITNLQQTPASSAKVMLRIFIQPPSSQTSETHVFAFTSVTTARAEADSLRDALSKAIQAAKSGGHSPAAGGVPSASMAMASAVTSKISPSDSSVLYDDEKLKQDAQLQQSLLKASPSLSRTFTESLRTKPESISISQLSNQFWSSRVHLLRAHAVEQNQTRGAYNVLSVIKPVTVDGTTKLSISKEQIQLIFKQHSLVKRVYDENVPKIREEDFWSKFFQSRLFKKLKGERIMDNDPTDAILDKYLQVDEDEERPRQRMSNHIPHIIDIEGNEENHSQRKGNDGDRTMRPIALNRAPVIRTLNALSEKILSQVEPNDKDPSEPIGMDEETFNELRLRDLQGEAKESRNILNIKDQSRFFASDKDSGVSIDALRYAKQDPSKALQILRADIDMALSHRDLSTAIGINEESDSSEDEDAEHESHVGSKASFAGATSQMLAAISEQRLQNDDTSSDSFSTVASTSTSGLSQVIFDRLTLTHATTTEFLNYFWSAFLSGSQSRAEEIGRLVESLDRAMDRIKAVAEDAENERQKVVQKYRKQIKEYNSKAKRPKDFDEGSISGGAKAVNQLFAPTMRAIEAAEKGYRKALKAQVDDEG
ncbi:uncharacterized protein KY384_004311 [Bacidia gigantensis]|uniref:uncharacterized protein n=1 Tax=Bacidia gigantensis TaxID=2732470 RepID=UPI001D039D75|nr:uncharacterized protein KY384_004311 [Bacidia gigantensis]KAG8530954.1 hypothetical protein KY384_004311 [Bacidia gigantensis]